MTEFRVVWSERDKRKAEKVLFVEAANSADAAEVAREHVERKFGIAHVLINAVKVATMPTPGRVLGDDKRGRYGKPITQAEIYGKPV